MPLATRAAFIHQMSPIQTVKRKLNQGRPRFNPYSAFSRPCMLYGERHSKQMTRTNDTAQPFMLISIYNGAKEGKIWMTASEMCVISIRLFWLNGCLYVCRFFRECSLVSHTHKPIKVRWLISGLKPKPPSCCEVPECWSLRYHHSVTPTELRKT